MELSESAMVESGTLDTLGRALRDLRISVIDNCNLRCTYCMPQEKFGEGYRFLSKDELLTFDEIVRLAELFTGLGAKKIRITGGEPLLRKGLPELIERLAAIEGVEDLALTTNGLLLRSQAPALREAGLGRLTVSLDSLDDAVFGRMNGRGVRVAHVLEGIEAARSAGFESIKINTVVQKGVNDDVALALAEHFRGSGCIVRFIEFMDAGNRNRWGLNEVVPSKTLMERIHARYPLRPVEKHYRGEVASRYAYEDGAGEVGFISSVTESFCGGCTRARLSANGKLYTCLFAGTGTDLKTPLRSGDSDEALLDRLVGLWRARDDRYSELRAAMGEEERHEYKVEMYEIGG